MHYLQNLRDPPAVSFFRQFIIPVIIFAIFLFTLVLVSSRAFLPDDMVAPAPVGVMVSALLSVFFIA